MLPETGPAAAPGRPRGLARWRPVLLLLCALGTGILIGNNPFRPGSTNPDATARGYLRFKEVLSYVDRDYADSVDTEGLADFAVQRMLEKLDPHSVYISAKERDAADSFLQGDFDGIGVEFSFCRDTATVVASLSGGPAEAAGLRPGDQLVQVGGGRGGRRRPERGPHQPAVSGSARQQRHAECAAPSAAAQAQHHAQPDCQFVN